MGFSPMVSDISLGSWRQVRMRYSNRLTDLEKELMVTRAGSGEQRDRPGVWYWHITLLLLLLSRFNRVRLCDPIDGSPPGSPVPGILQVRTLEWVAISFSNAWKWKGKVKSLSRVRLCATPWTAAPQAPPSMGCSMGFTLSVGKSTEAGCHSLVCFK